MTLELAELFIRAGELSEALDALNAELESQPDDQAALRLRANLLTHLPGRGREALTDLDTLSEATLDDHLLRIHVLDTLGDHDAAFEVIERLWMDRGDAQSVTLMLRALQRRGEFDRALELLADLPKSWNWLGWSGDFYALKGDYSIAAEHFCSAIDQLEHAERNPLSETQRAHLLLKRADAYRRLKQYADADADYRSAEAIIPSDPMIPFNRGLLIFEQGDLRRALPLCRDAMDHAPDALRDHMRNVLMDNPRYHMLAQALMA